MTQPLKDAVREHLQEKQLDEQQLQNLEALLEQSSEQPGTKPPSKRNRALLLLVACILIAPLLTFFLLSPPKQTNTLAREIAREVAYNHIKLKPLEIQASQVRDTKTFFAKLDFALVEDSTVLKAQPWKLQGARYCSIQGEDAAQLRFKHNKETISVYMAPYKPKTMGSIPSIHQKNNPLQIQAQGITVWIWVENQVLLAATVPNKI